MTVYEARKEALPRWEAYIVYAGGSGARVAFPLNYFDNVVSYSPENRFRYNVKGAYNAWQSDTFQ